ncbi:MAG: hypothetical protein JW881_05325 [Spirochaetales bacterium]|nr:hypothetical protein [Spirochaetales bacterium]
MSDAENFIDQLEQTLIKKREYIEVANLPRLKEHLGFFQTYFQNVYNILIRKALLQEDPYKGEEKISEVTVPSSDPPLDSGTQDQMSHRICAYHTQLEFLNNYYQLSLDFLDLRRVKRITELMKYINWMQLTPTSTDPPTRFIGEALHKIKMGSDKISIQIIVDSSIQLDKHLRVIYGLLEELILLLREMYKLEVRKLVLPNIEEDLRLLISNPDSAIKAVKSIFPKYIAKKPFYPELIKEIFQEDYSERGVDLKRTLLSRLEVKEKKAKKKKKVVQYKPIILQGLRIIAGACFHIKDAITKLNENQETYESRKMGIGERILRWLRKLIRGKDDSQMYDIEFFDVTTSTTKREKLNFAAFIEDLENQVKFYTALANKASSTYQKYEAATEEKLYEVLNRNLANLHVIHRRFSGLNDFFRNEIPKAKRNKIRGLNLEINAVKNSIIKANKKKHEYVSAIEEREQMKRLGIKTEE